MNNLQLDFTTAEIVKGDKERNKHCFFFYIFNKYDGGLLFKRTTNGSITLPFYELSKLGNKPMITPSAMLGVSYMKEEMNNVYKYLRDECGALIHDTSSLKFVISLKYGEFVNHYITAYVNQDVTGKDNYKFISNQKMKELSNKIVDDSYKWLAPMSKYLLDNPDKKYEYAIINVK